MMYLEGKIKLIVKIVMNVWEKLMRRITELMILILIGTFCV